ncbi:MULTISPECIES: hypothetical protein [unclassified Fusibacter]|uniref:hypothetical protein n=1 Tax=unclassified Fusibacter TaxID=2624464 RepID=UPI0010115BF8|nr:MULTISPECIES: hypothetical protein [unclassified Fusibacter]MCK8061113.1 S1 family peptidase [Fusibacter sp. A2]NPE23351.1 hypothetical protein [Fusibacter sp. A1]RXV59395.1 hypothetical protein DWB64_16150 [Fusibacter sp. A1]
MFKKIISIILSLIIILTMFSSADSNKHILTPSEKKQVESISVYELLEANGFGNIPLSLEHDNDKTDFYAGAYLDVDGTLILNISKEDNQLKKALKDIYKDADVKIKVVKNDIKSLYKVFNGIEKMMLAGNIDEVEINSVSIDLINNVISVGVHNLKDSDYTFFSKLYNKSEIVLFEKAVSDSAISTVDGGAKIKNGSAYSSLTIGAERNGVNGWIDSGHGNRHDLYTYWGTQTMGTVAASTFSSTSSMTSDAAFIASNGRYAISNQLMNGETIVGYNTYPLPGMQVWKYGYRTNESSGMIQSISWTHTTDDGWVYTDHVQATFSADHGDSGGPVYYYSGNGVRIVGVLDTYDFENNLSGFSKISRVLNNLDIDYLIY